MINIATWVLVGILALFAAAALYERRSRGERLEQRDLEELNEVVNGILRREKGRAGRERAQLSRDLEAAGPDVPGVAAPPDLGSIGGVVRQQIPQALTDTANELEGWRKHKPNRRA